MDDDRWPPLPYDAWKDTYATLHMWTQVVGKVAVALAPSLNHSWGITLRTTARGLTTLPLVTGDRTFTIEFDFIDHVLHVRASDGAARDVRLEPKSVAAFYHEVRQLLRDMDLDVRMWPVPVEIPAPIPFAQDTGHASYDPFWANRFWRILVRVAHVFEQSRCPFLGKCSPVQFFWGSFDLAVTRFSGRRAPPREGPRWMQDAYSHEVISHGFWPGSGPLLEPAFYAYAVPPPDGFAEAKVLPDAAYWHAQLREFVLPYEVVRTSADPEREIRAFIDSTYEAGADLGKWDRAALEKAAG